MSYQNPSSKNAFRLSTPRRLGVAAVAACFISTPALSLPVSPTVVNGAASFNQAGNVLTVTNSPGAIINWQKFSIKAGETTHFAQTSTSSTVLNRVLSDPTAIYGTLSSNGRVWLVNPAGIMVGPGGRVDVAGFVASTLNIRNEDFLAGRSVFINDSSAKNVINQGEIRTPAGGSVYLIGSNVTNEGIITTPRGETILAAGATVSLIDSATPGVKVDITGAEGNATNLGTITAEAGRIGIAGVIVRNSGLLNASSVVSEGGRVFLKASQDAYVDGSGRIVTTGTKGGSVEVLGNRVAIMDNAEIDASGVNGGGRIMIGGDYQGKNPEIQNAGITYFGPDATLKADATEVGDGGTVIVWADDTTRAHGSISARGGALGGNGGFVETSGHRSLSIAGARVDTRAPNGQTGNWLLDPSDIMILSGGISYGGGLGSVFDPLVATQTITDGDVNAALATSNLTIQTVSGSGGSGLIAASGVNIYGGNSLTLAAYGGVAGATGNINITGSTFNVNGGVTMLAGWDGGGFSSGNVIPGTGDISIVASTIQSNSGAINLWAGRDLTITGGATPTYIGSEYGGGAIGVQVGGNIFLNGGAGGVLIGSLDDSAGNTFVDISAGKNLTVTGNTGGVWLGVGNLTGSLFNSVNLTAGTDNSAGGNIEMVGPTHIQTDASGSVNLTAFQVTAGNGNITQNAGSIIYGGNVTFRADGNLTLTGGTYAGSDIQTVAGYFSPYGGDVVIGGQLQAAGDIEIVAMSGYVTGTRGSITQQSGSILNGGYIAILANGDVDLSGTVTAGYSLNLTSGTEISCDGSCGSGNYASPQGGNVFIRGGANISAGGYALNIAANVGYGAYGNGNITQYGGSSIVAVNGDINIFAGGSVSLGGTVSASSGYVSVKAGYQEGYFGIGYGVTPYGGNITVSGALSGYYGVQLIAESGSLTGLNGDITQSAGSITAGYGEVRIIGGGNVTLNGSIDGGEGYSAVTVQSGYSGYNSTATPYGGNISVAGTISGYGYVGLYAAAGTSTGLNGDINQSSGSISSYGIAINADGNLYLDGAVANNLAGGGVYGVAGYSGAAGKTLRISNISSPIGGYLFFQSTGDAVIGSINAPAGQVFIQAGGAIRDNNGTNVLNITADSISLNSQSGGVAGGLAISMDTSATSSLFGYVAPGATNGGISIRNFGAQPGFVSIDDGAVSNAAFNFYNSGNLTLNANTSFSFSTSSYGSAQIGTGGILNVTSSISAYDLNLSGATINVDGFVTAANNIQLAATTINVNSGGVVEADHNVALVTPLVGGTINLLGEVVANGTSATPSTIIGIPYTGIAFIAQDLNANAYGGIAHLQTTTTTGDISGLVSGNITLDYGSHFTAGNDIQLVFSGADSTLSLSNGSYLLADEQTGVAATIYLDFLARSSSGVLINGVATTTSSPGGSGFFVINEFTPAVAGAGLEITYGNSTSIVVDPCAISPDLCSPPSPIENPVVDVVEADPCAINPDSAECKLQGSGDEKEIIGSFGGQEGNGTQDENSSQGRIPTCSI